ncbi:hypothetical protein EEB14_13370 [Rhodococcus sp. WS4]|nr:hypothetical protein EEB14_13370 [Rhodococcus sp. WS4]
MTTAVSEGMLWAVKSSLRDYVAALPDGNMVISGGGGISHPADEFYFELADATGYDKDRLAGLLRFRGAIHFSGHAGLLSVSIVDPWVGFGGRRGLLSVSVGGERILLAELRAISVSRGQEAMIFVAAEVTLSGSAVPMFSHAYPEGEVLAPVSIRIRMPAP